MATLTSSATLKDSLERRSGKVSIALSPDLPKLKIEYTYEAVQKMDTFNAILVRLKARVIDNWYSYQEEDKNPWDQLVLYSALTVSETSMSSGFGFELVLEELHRSVVKELHNRFDAGSLIYKEKDIEGLTEVYPPIEVLKVA